MTAKDVHLILTPAQARCVNKALARMDADDLSEELAEDRHLLDVLNRTRHKVWLAMEAAGTGQ